MMSDLPVFELKMREGATGPMTGANTELFMDGKKMGSVAGVKVEVRARGLAKITLEMYGQFHVLGKYEPAQVSIVPLPLPEVPNDQSEE